MLIPDKNVIIAVDSSGIKVSNSREERIKGKWNGLKRKKFIELRIAVNAKIAKKLAIAHGVHFKLPRCYAVLNDK